MARGSRRKKPPPGADHKPGNLIRTPLVSALTGGNYVFNSSVAEKQVFLYCSPVDGTDDPPPGTEEYLKSCAQAFAAVHDVITSPDYLYYVLILTLKEKEQASFAAFLKPGLLTIPFSKSTLQVEKVAIYEVLQEVLTGKDLERLHAMELEEVDNRVPLSSSSDEETSPTPPRKRQVLTQAQTSKPVPDDSQRSAPSLSNELTLPDDAAMAHNSPDNEAPSLLPAPRCLSTTTAPTPVPLTTDSAPSTSTTDASPSTSATDSNPPLLTQPAPTTQPPKTPAQCRARVRYLAVDLSKINVVVPAPEPRLTVIYRPSDPDTRLDRLHPLRVNNQLEALGGPILSTRTIRNGGLAVDFAPDTPSDKLLAVTKLLSTPVTASLPVVSNSCIGVLHGIHPEFTKEEIIAETRTEPETPILDVQRMAKPGQESWTVKVTFQDTQLPTKAFLAGRCFRIRRYESRPLQCFHCGRYGHAAKVCRSQQRCWTCSELHDASSCPNKAIPLCSCCGGPHPADSPTCPARSFQLKVGAVKAEHNVTFKAARSAVTKAVKEHRSYAAVAKGAASKPSYPAARLVEHPNSSIPRAPAFFHNTAHPRPPQQPADATVLATLFKGIIQILATVAATNDLTGAVSRISQLLTDTYPTADPSLFTPV